MKKVACADIDPGTTCDFEATGDTTKEAVSAMMAHAKAEHADDLKGMSDADFRKKIEANVKDA